MFRTTRHRIQYLLGKMMHHFTEVCCSKPVVNHFTEQSFYRTSFFVLPVNIINPHHLGQVHCTCASTFANTLDTQVPACIANRYSIQPSTCTSAL